MALRRPSQKSIDLYNRLVAEQNKVRKTLRKIHKNAEESIGAGRLPALVVPKKARKITQRFFDVDKSKLAQRVKEYWKKLKDMKLHFMRGIESYLAETVMKGYKELWLDSQYGIGEEPEGYFGRFSEEQIRNSDNPNAMRSYNALFTNGAQFFLALLYSDKIIPFKYIYMELQGIGGREYSYLEQQVDILSPYVSRAERYKLMDEASEITGYKHKESTLKKAREKEKRARKNED